MVSRKQKIALVATVLLVLLGVWTLYSGPFQMSGLRSSAIPMTNFICSAEWQKTGLSAYQTLKSAVDNYTSQSASLRTQAQKLQESLKDIQKTIKKQQATVTSEKKQIASLKNALSKCVAGRLNTWCNNEKKQLANGEKQLKNAEKSVATSKKQRDQMVKNMKSLQANVTKLNTTYQENVGQIQNYELCEKSLAGKVTLSNPNMLSGVTVVAEAGDNIDFYNFALKYNTFGGWKWELIAEEIVFAVDMSKDADFDTWTITQYNNENNPVVSWNCTLSDSKKLITCVPKNSESKFVLSNTSVYENTTLYSLGAVARNIGSNEQIIIKNAQIKLSDAQTTIEWETTQKITKYEKWVPPTLVNNISADIYWSPENENQKTITNHSITTGNLNITVDSIFYPMNISYSGLAENMQTANTIKEAFLMQWDQKMAMSCTPQTALGQHTPTIYGVLCTPNGNATIPKWTTTDMRLVIDFVESSITYTSYHISSPNIFYSMGRRQYYIWEYQEPYRLYITNEDDTYWYTGDWNYNSYPTLKRMVECRKTGAKVADTLCTQKKPVTEQIILQNFVIVSPWFQTVKKQENANYSVQITNTSWKTLENVSIRWQWGQSCALAPDQTEGPIISGELRVRPLHTWGATEFFDPNETIEYTCGLKYPHLGSFWESNDFIWYSLSGDTVAWGWFHFVTIVEDTPLCDESTPDSSDGETIWEIGFCRAYESLQENL